jgi:hypothetical protein
MRSSLILAFTLLAACGSNNSGNKTDANGGGDGAGGDTPGGGNPTTVTVTLNNRPNTAATYTFLTAYQDGAGAWQAAPAPSGDTYSFTINSPVWGFAWTCIVPGTTPAIARVELAYFTVAEKKSLTETIPNGCTDRTMNVGVTGTTSNLGGGGTAAFRADYATASRALMTNGNWGLEGPPGPHDLFLTHGAIVGTGAVVDKVVRTTATGPQTGIALDYSTAVTADTATATVPTGAAATSTLYSAGGTQVTLALGGTTLVGLHSTQAMTGDIYQLSSTTRGQGSTETSEIWATTVAAQTFTAPAGLGGATSTVTGTTPYPIIKTTWNPYTSAVGYAWDARQGAGGTAAGSPLQWTAILGPGYVGAMPAFQMPDLSMLTGWSASFQPVTGQMVTGTALAETSSAGAADFPTVNPAASGTTRTVVTSGWNVTP